MADLTSASPSVTNLSATTESSINHTTSDTLNATAQINYLAPYLEATSNIWIYLGLPTLILGTFGHILGIIVILHRRKSRKTPATVYLVSLSSAGILLLIIPLFQIVLTSLLPNQADPFRGYTSAGCKIHVLLTYFILHFCAWLQATIAVDRLLFVATPVRYKVIVTWQRALVVIACEFFVLLGADGVYAYYVDLRGGVCTYRAELTTFHVPLSFFDTLIYSILPGLIMIIIYIFIITIYSRKQIKLGISRSTKNKNGGRLGAVFITLNIVFLITSLPSCILSIILAYDRNLTPDQEARLNTLGWTMTNMLSYIGGACTFIVYCVAGSQFRNTLKNMFSRNPTLTSSTNSATVTKMSASSMSIHSTMCVKANNTERKLSNH